MCQSWDAEFLKTLPEIYQYLRLILRVIKQCLRYNTTKYSVTQHGVYCVETEPAPSGCVHIHLSSVGSESQRIPQEQCMKRSTGSHQLRDSLHGMDRSPYLLLSSFGSFNAQSLSQMNPRKPFLRIIFRYIFKAKFSAQTLTLAAKHLQMMPTWGANIGLEVKSGIGSWLSIFGNYVTSMGFTFFPPHRQ